MLSTTDTIPDLARRAREAAAEVRLARIRGSKTNMEYLMNAGVIITCDDEMDAAYLYDHLHTEAKRLGITYSEMQERHAQEGAENSVVGMLRLAVHRGETNEEAQARHSAILGAVVGLQENGKPCKHNSTQRERGWMDTGGRAGATQDAWVCTFVCCRCGAKGEYPERRDVPTEQALIAAVILAAASLPVEFPTQGAVAVAP